MDTWLGRFLGRVRPRTRAANHAIYEDLVVALDDYLRARRKRAEKLGPADLECFIGYWALRESRLPEGGARRFCAALRVLVGDLARQVHGERAPALRRAARRAARAASRAARATELLEEARDQAPGPESGCDEAEFLDGYWVVILRSESYAVVRALGGRRLVGPVLLPAPVLRLLGPGDVINMCVVPVGQHWCVLEHGPCYPSSAITALRGTQPVSA